MAEGLVSTCKPESARMRARCGLRRRGADWRHLPVRRASESARKPSMSEMICQGGGEAVLPRLLSGFRRTRTRPCSLLVKKRSLSRSCRSSGCWDVRGGPEEAAHGLVYGDYTAWQLYRLIISQSMAILSMTISALGKHVKKDAKKACT